MLVAFVAVAAYANSVGNGFAYDDEGIIEQNPVVTTGDWEGAVAGSWWPEAMEGAGLYRPFTTLAFVGEWKAFSGSPAGFHAVNVLLHGLVSVLAFVLLFELGSLGGALAGALTFAVHPVHTEAVANVVGQAELHAALFYVLACILYWKGRDWEGGARVLRLLGLGLLYFLSLASKEIGVTLPGALLLLEVAAPRLRGARGDGASGENGEPGGAAGLPLRLRREAGVFLLLPLVLVAYLELRFFAVGTIVGEAPSPLFAAVGPQARLLSAVALWVQYVRLLLFPLDLSADYDPGVLFLSESVDVPVAAGILVILTLAVLAVRSWKARPLIAVGILWFVVAVSPVSNVFFATGVLLAERTLYLPSLGLSLVVAGLAPSVLALSARRRRVALAAVAVGAVALTVRTVTRNPAWLDTFVVTWTLNEEHPESWRAVRARAQGLQRVGEVQGAAEAWRLAAVLAPHDHILLVQVGDFLGRLGDGSEGEAYMRRAIAVAPRVVNSYRILGANLLRRGFGREGHRVALEGLARTGNDRALWALVSESYILKGDLPAAARARQAAIGADPEEPAEWRRLGEILAAMGDADGAGRARVRADALEAAAAERGDGVRRE